MALQPRHAALDANYAAPVVGAVAVTTSDVADLTVSPCRGIYVGVSGDVKIDTPAGDTVTLTGLAAGMMHPIGAKRIYSTGTTATGILALY